MKHADDKKSEKFFHTGNEYEKAWWINNRFSFAESYHQSRVNAISDEVSKLELKILELEETFYDKKCNFILEDLEKINKLLKQ